MHRLIAACVLLSSCTAHYVQQRPAASSPETLDPIPAWYQMPKAQLSSPSYYERREPAVFERPLERPAIQHTNTYAGYPSYGSRQPFESLSSLPSRRYPTPSNAGIADQTPYESNLSRYHKLLLRKLGLSTTTPRSIRPFRRRLSTTFRRRSSPSTTTVETTSTTPEATTLTTTTRRMPKSLRKLYSTFPPVSSEASTTVKATTEPIALPVKKIWKKVTAKQEVSTTITTMPSKETPPSEKLAVTAPPRFICQHKAGSDERPTTPERPTISPFRRLEKKPTFKPLTFVRPTTTGAPDAVAGGNSGSSRARTLLEYLLPNAELLAAIKDVVAKFKASLDETGIDQDVRLMSNQLRNTWQQLRTGLDRGLKAVRQSAEHSVNQLNRTPFDLDGPMNEQLGRLFEKAAADATDKRQP